MKTHSIPFSFTLLGLGCCSEALGRQWLSSSLLPAQETHEKRPQTPIASPTPTVPPKPKLELFKRAEGDSICGYISGVKTYASAIDCGVDWACIPEPGGKHFGCSKSGEGSFFETACFGRDELTTNTDEYRTLWCNWNTNLPYCATGTYTDGVYSGYTNVFCDNIGGYYPLSHSPSQFTQTLTPTPSVATVTKEGETKVVTQSPEIKTVVQTAADTKVEEGDGSPTETAVQDGGGGGASRGGGAGASSEDEDSSKDTSAGTVESGAPAATDQGSSSSSFPIGAVVGGAVGGVAVLGLLALAFFIVIRRGKQKHQDHPGSSSAMVNAGAYSQHRHSIYPTGLEVAHLPKPSSTPPSSTASPQLNENGSRTSTVLLSPSSASPVQQQRESYSPSMHYAQPNPAVFPNPVPVHPQYPPTGYNAFQDPRASHHAELPVQVYTQPHGQMPAQPQTAPYAPQTTFHIQSVSEMPVERGDRELRELGQYR